MTDKQGEPVEPVGAPDETKHGRFVRLAQKRTQHVLERLRILGNCANRAVYDYEPQDVEKILRAIQDELDQTRRKFDERMKKRVEFKL